MISQKSDSEMSTVILPRYFVERSLSQLVAHVV